MHPYHNVNKPNICSFFRNIKSIKNIWIFNEWCDVCNQNYPLLLHTMEAWRVQHNLGHFFATPYTRFIVCLGIFSSAAWLQGAGAGGGAGGSSVLTPHSTLHTVPAPPPLAWINIQLLSTCEFYWTKGRPQQAAIWAATPCAVCTVAHK